MDTSSSTETTETPKITIPRATSESKSLNHTPPKRISPSDEEVYSSYVAILSGIHDGYDSLIAKAQRDAEWYQEKRYEANGIAQRLRGTPTPVNSPSIPSENTVKNELTKASQKADELQIREEELSKLQEALREKQKEIDSRNNWIIIGTIVYFAGVVIVGALSKNIVAGLLWPLIVVGVVIGFWILSLFAGGN